jgi:phosphoglycolate phosphatase-like HAD superfamily hydrolase
VRRLVLFDIDGTLVADGPAKDAFVTAMVETFGTAGEAERLSFAGKTDPQIARELLSGSGLDGSTIERGFADLWRRYLGYLEVWLVDRPMRVLPGVAELLDALAGWDDVGIGLVTGNIEGGARLKLGSAGLWSWFRVGGYGSDHEERDELPAFALARARALWGRVITPDDAFVVGDTPRDVLCGQAGGIRTLGVATGSYPASELAGAGADHVVEDLTCTGELVSLLTD